MLTVTGSMWAFPSPRPHDGSANGGKTCFFLAIEAERIKMRAYFRGNRRARILPRRGISPAIKVAAHTDDVLSASGRFRETSNHGAPLVFASVAKPFRDLPRPGKACCPGWLHQAHKNDGAGGPDQTENAPGPPNTRLVCEALRTETRERHRLGR